MSVPAPPFPRSSLGKSLYQTGGPIGVNSGASTGAITFGLSFPDASYVEGGDAAVDRLGPDAHPLLGRCTADPFQGDDRNTSNSAFIWSAWRI